MAAIGQFLHASATSYYTPWSGRGGNSAVMVLEVISATITGPSGKVRVTVQTKNSEDSDAAVDSLGSFADITAASPTPYTFFATGFEELYRLKIEFISAASTDWIHFRELEASWLWN